jgi:hypothetical protein
VYKTYIAAQLNTNGEKFYEYPYTPIQMEKATINSGAGIGRDI